MLHKYPVICQSTCRQLNELSIWSDGFKNSFNGWIFSYFYTIEIDVNFSRYSNGIFNWGEFKWRNRLSAKPKNHSFFNVWESTFQLVCKNRREFKLIFDLFFAIFDIFLYLPSNCFLLFVEIISNSSCKKKLLKEILFRNVSFLLCDC